MNTPVVTKLADKTEDNLYILDLINPSGGKLNKDGIYMLECFKKDPQGTLKAFEDKL